MQVTAVLTVSIFVINAALQPPLLDSALFALAIAVGLTPQLLPAIVTISLSTGARRLAAARSVIVKRLVSIEDLGNIEVLFTDKTGTLTEGRITFAAALDPSGRPSDADAAQGLLCNARTVGRRRRRRQPARPGALVGAGRRADAVAGVRRLAAAPFDYERRLSSVLVQEPGGERRVIARARPRRCSPAASTSPEEARAVLDAQFDARRAGHRRGDPRAGDGDRR